MTNVVLMEKRLGLDRDERKQDIVVTHVTIRQSITFLVLRLLLLEALAAVAIIIFHTFLISTDIRSRIDGNISLFNIPLFVILVFIKAVLTILIVEHWLNEYYEITPTEMISRKGLLFKQEQKHLLKHLGSLELDQGIFGRIFNFGTLRLHNWATEKDLFLYLIHNPVKYHRILEYMLPEADKEEHVVRKHILEEDI